MCSSSARINTNVHTNLSSNTSCLTRLLRTMWRRPSQIRRTSMQLRNNSNRKLRSNKTSSKAGSLLWSRNSSIRSISFRMCTPSSRCLCLNERNHVICSTRFSSRVRCRRHPSSGLYYQCKHLRSRRNRSKDSDITQSRRICTIRRLRSHYRVNHSNMRIVAQLQLLLNQWRSSIAVLQDRSDLL